MSRRLWLCVVTVGLAYGAAACTSILGDFPSRPGGQADGGLDALADRAPPIDGPGSDARHDVGPPMDAPGGDVGLEDSPAFDGQGSDSESDAVSGDGPFSDSPSFDSPADTPPPTFTLKVVLAGTGTGTVTSSPSGISCPGTCSMAVVDGTKVKLTQTPDVGSVWGGWSGACTGTSGCDVDVTSNKTATATFKPHTPTTWDPTWSLPGASYTGGDLSVSNTVATTVNVRTTINKSKGSYYWEITATAGSSSLNGGGIGLVRFGMKNNVGYIGKSPQGMAFGYKDGTIYINWVGAAVAAPGPPSNAAINAGVIYMFAIDLTSGLFWAGQNGTWYNSGDPAGGTNATVTGVKGPLYPGITFYGSSTNAFTGNFGDSAFSYPAPSGFTPGFY